MCNLKNDFCGKSKNVTSQEILISLILVNSILTINAQIWSGSTPGNIYYNQGNVGIGTTGPETQTEIQRIETVNRQSYNDILTISANATTNPWIGHGGGILFKGTNYQSGVSNVNYARIGSTINSNSIVPYGSNLFFDVAPLSDGVLSRAMTINYNGNVGIGTTNPQAKLDIAGTTGKLLQVGTLTNDWGGNIAFGVQDGNGLILSKINTANNTISNRVASLTRSDALGGTLHLYDITGNIDVNLRGNGDSYINGGNVGIGTTTPAYTLDVNGILRVQGNVIRSGSGPVIFFNGTSGAWAPISVQGVNMGDWDTNPSYGDIRVGTYNFDVLRDDGSSMLTILNGGNVGIGTTAPAYKLDVIGTIRAREIKVDLSGADFVFEKGYQLMPLNELEQFIKEQKHLPEIAPAKEMEENGTDLGSLNSKLLQKIEELTLYILELEKRVKVIESKK